MCNNFGPATSFSTVHWEVLLFMGLLRLVFYIQTCIGNQTNMEKSSDSPTPWPEPNRKMLLYQPTPPKKHFCLLYHLEYYGLLVIFLFNFFNAFDIFYAT